MLHHIRILLPIVLTTTLLADQVTLKNGDRLSGTIVESTATLLTLKSEFLGEVKIKWDAIEQISSDQPLYVTSESNQTLVGPVTTDGPSFRVQTKDSGPVTVEKSVVTAIRSQEAYDRAMREIERLRNPSLLDFWAGYVDTSIASAQGNANTFTWANAAQAIRTTRRDKISLNFVSIYTRVKTDDGDIQATANAIRGNTRYDVNFSPKLFGFGGLNLEFDEFQRLDLRAVVLGGLGYRMIQSDVTKLELFGGSSYNNEFFRDLTRRSAELVFGDEFEHKFGDWLSFTQRLAVYPNLNQRGDYRMQFDAGFVTRINNLLSWQVTASDRYQSNPIPGVKTNDVLLSTGVRLTFAKPKN